MSMRKQSGLRKTLWILALVVLTGGLSLTLSVSVVYAQAASFSSLTVQGNQRIEASTIRNFAALDLSNPVTPGQINAAYQRLIATGLFEAVKIIPNRGTLVVQVQEYPTINRINFERNKKLKDEKLAEIVTSRPRHTYSPAQAEADAALIVAAYRQAGRYTAEVKPKIIRRSDNRVDLVFEIFEGSVIEIERLSFIGNRSFSDNRLRRVLATKQAGILRQLIKSDTFVADRISFDKQVLTDFYVSRGFIDFQVLSVATEVVRDRSGFFLTFDVREGQSYKFGNITTSTELSEIVLDEFNKLLKVATGQTYSPAPMETTIELMEALATQKGLNFIRVNPQVTRNDKNLTLDINFVIERGPRVFVERIDIEGNDTTLDRVIRREFTVVEGDPFNPREIRAAANRIEALGFFETSNVTTREGSGPNQVIVDVNVKDKPTGSLGFGLTYSGSAGVGGTVNLSESNFLGRGQAVSFDLGGGQSATTYGVSFSEPRFLDKNLQLGFDLSQTKTTRLNASYDATNVGFTPSLTFPLSREGKLKVSYRYGVDTLNNFYLNASPILKADKGSRTSGALSVSYIRDTRDSGLREKTGTIFRLTQEMAGLGGAARYSKTSFLVGGQTTTFNEEVSFSAELEGGFLIDQTGTSNVSNRFFLNSDIMRGFRINGIGPRDTIAGKKDALGGNMYAVARFESSFPLGLPEEYGIAGGVYLDVGTVWGLNAGSLALQPGVDASMHVRSTVGFSIFWKTILGPLRFNFSRALVKQTYDQPEVFSLTIGTRF